MGNDAQPLNLKSIPELLGARKLTEEETTGIGKDDSGRSKTGLKAGLLDYRKFGFVVSCATFVLFPNQRKSRKRKVGVTKERTRFHRHHVPWQSYLCA